MQTTTRFKRSNNNFVVEQSQCVFHMKMQYKETSNVVINANHCRDDDDPTTDANSAAATWNRNPEVFFQPDTSVTSRCTFPFHAVDVIWQPR